MPAPSSVLEEPHEQLAERLAAITRQESAQTRADDVPRLVGLILLIWGVVVTLGGLVMLAKGRGPYVFASGLAMGGVGWLLFKLRRLALPAHAVALLAALGWAWSAANSASLLEVFIQSAPVLIPAFWMLAPQVRDPLQ